MRKVIPSWIYCDPNDADAVMSEIHLQECLANEEFESQCDLEGEEREQARKEFLKNKGFYLADMES